MNVHQTVPSSNIGQRVYNVYHHLQDCSLPYDLWTEDAEYAALVHLLRRRTLADVLTVYPRLLFRYNESNRRIGIAVTDLSGYEIEHRVRKAAAFCSRFGKDASDAEVYVSLINQLEQESRLAEAA